MKNKTRKIYYKKVVLTNQSDETLQSILEKKLFSKEDKKRLSDREEEISSNSVSKRLVNSYTTKSGMFFGQLISYNEGDSQAFLSKTNESLTYEIKTISAKDIDKDKDKRSEFIESILYFGCYKNHLVVLQSPSLTVKSLESHLSWLLHDYKEILKSGEQIILQDRATKKAKNQIREIGTKAITIGSPLAFSQKTPQEKNNQAKKITWSPKTLGANIIKQIIGKNEWDNFKIKNSLEDQNITVQLTVKYKRKTGDTGQKILDDLSTTIRNLDEEDCKVQLNDGSIIEGSELKISTTINIPSMPNGLIIESDLYHIMSDWLLKNYRSKNIVD